MAERKKVSSLTGVRTVSQPAAGAVDTFAAPMKNPLSDVVSSLQNFNTNLASYGEKKYRAKEEEDLAKVEYYAQQIRIDNKENIVDKVRVGEVHPSLSPKVQMRVAQRLGEIYAEDWVSKKIVEMSLDEGIRTNAVERKGYYSKFMAELLEEVRDKPFFGNGALTKAKVLLEQRENNYLEEEIALTRDIQAKGYSSEIEGILTNTELSIPQMTDLLLQSDQAENEQGGMHTGPERIDILIDSVITTTKAIAINDPERALEIIGDVNNEGEIVGGVIPQMIGDANVLGTQEYKEKIVTAIGKLKDEIEGSEAENRQAKNARINAKINQMKTALSIHLDENNKNGVRSFIDITAWVKENFPEALQGEFLDGNVLGVIEDRYATIRNRPDIDPKVSRDNVNSAFSAIEAVAITGTIQSLENLDNDSANLIQEYFETTTGGVVNLSDDHINNIADILNLNNEEYLKFRDEVANHVDAANTARNSHNAHFEKQIVHNMIDREMEGLSLKISQTIEAISDTPLNMKGHITDLYDNFVQNRYMAIYLETGSEPTIQQINEIYSAAVTRVNDEIQQYKEFAQEYLNEGLSDEQRKALPRPEEDNLSETIRINQAMAATITAEDLQQAGIEGIEPGEYVVRRVDFDSEEPNTFTVGARKFKIENKIEQPDPKPTEEEIEKEEKIKKEEELANRPPEEKIKLSTDMITTETYDPPGIAKPTTKITDVEFDDEQKQIIASMYAEIFDDLTKKKADTTNVKVSQSIQPERDAKIRIYKAVMGDMKWKGPNKKFIEDMINKIIADSISVN